MDRKWCNGSECSSISRRMQYASKSLDAKVETMVAAAMPQAVCQYESLRIDQGGASSRIPIALALGLSLLGYGGRCNAEAIATIQGNDFSVVYTDGTPPLELTLGVEIPIIAEGTPCDLQVTPTTAYVQFCDLGGRVDRVDLASGEVLEPISLGTCCGGRNFAINQQESRLVIGISAQAGTPENRNSVAFFDLPSGNYLFAAQLEHSPGRMLFVGERLVVIGTGASGEALASVVEGGKIVSVTPLPMGQGLRIRGVVPEQMCIGDVDADSEVTVDEILNVVDAALNGCN